MIERDIAREKSILRRVRSGEPYASIAIDWGISRERVRQIATRNGILRSPYLQAIREHRLEMRGRAIEVRRQREREAKAARLRRRAEILATIRDLASQVGRTPTIAECTRAGLYQTTIEYSFGSVRKAMRRAGLPPRPTGRPKRELAVAS